MKADPHLITYLLGFDTRQQLRRAWLDLTEQDRQALRPCPELADHARKILDAEPVDLGRPWFIYPAEDMLPEYRRTKPAPIMLDEGWVELGYTDEDGIAS